MSSGTRGRNAGDEQVEEAASSSQGGQQLLRQDSGLVRERKGPREILDRQGLSRLGQEAPNGEEDLLLVRGQPSLIDSSSRGFCAFNPHLGLLPQFRLFLAPHLRREQGRWGRRFLFHRRRLRRGSRGRGDLGRGGRAPPGGTVPTGKRKHGPLTAPT